MLARPKYDSSIVHHASEQEAKHKSTYSVDGSKM